MSRAALAVTALVSAVLAVPALTTAVSAPASALTAGSTYVALGDSYSSAPGVPSYVAGTACSRSTQNYAHLTASDLGLALSDVTCSAAGSGQLTQPQYDSNGQLVQGPQLDALTPDAALVTLGLGANDGDYFWNMLVGWPMDDAAAADRIRANVVENVGRIRAIAPAARVVVVGYPALYPASGWCEELLLPADQIPRAYARNRALADAMRTGAEQAGTDFIELFDRSAGHDICSAEPWMQGKTGTWGVATPFHPRLVEQQVVRDALVQLIGPVEAPAPPSSSTSSSTSPPAPEPTESAASTATASPTPSATGTSGATPGATAPTSDDATSTASATTEPAAVVTPTTTAASPTTTPTTTTATPTASATATTTAPARTSTTTAPAPTPTSTTPAMPTITWYARRGRPIIWHRVGVPRPTCSPAVCSVSHRWRINGVLAGTDRSLYLRRAWLGKYVSVRVIVRAYGMTWTRTYRWSSPIRRP